MERLTSLFAPDDCLQCGREGSLLCHDCNSALPPLQGRCYGCRKQIIGAGCADCVALSGLVGLQVTADYRGVAKALIGQLKFNGNQSAARIIARQLPLPKTGLIVNMPATTAHVRQRGFDQSRLIARQLSRRAGLPYCDVLRRSGQQHQLGADRQQRLRQLQASLRVANPALVRGQDIIVVDDVLTTGSSIMTAAKVLRKAGARSVSAIVFAQSINKTD